MVPAAIRQSCGVYATKQDSRGLDSCWATAKTPAIAASRTIPASLMIERFFACRSALRSATDTTTWATCRAEIPARDRPELPPRLPRFGQRLRVDSLRGLNTMAGAHPDGVPATWTSGACT